MDVNRGTVGLSFRSHNGIWHLVTEAEHKSEFVLTKDTTYFALKGELWGVCCEDFGEN